MGAEDSRKNLKVTASNGLVRPIGFKGKKKKNKEEYYENKSSKIVESEENLSKKEEEKKKNKSLGKKRIIRENGNNVDDEQVNQFNTEDERDVRKKKSKLSRNKKRNYNKTTEAEIGEVNMLSNELEDGLDETNGAEAGAKKKSKSRKKKRINEKIKKDEIAEVVELYNEVEDGSNLWNGKMLEAKYNLYWTPFAAHCLDLMLEDIFKLPQMKRTFERAVSLSSYIYTRPGVVNMMREFTSGKELLRPAKTRFATAFITLQRIHEQKNNLRKMFSSEMWCGSKWAKEPMGKKSAEIIMLPSFWNNVVFGLKVAGPLVRVLRLVDGEKKPAMGYIYEAMDRAKETIVRSFDGNEAKYKEVFHIIDDRWDIQLHRPLHAAGHFLNPEYFYSNPNIEQQEEVMGGLYKCIEKLVPNPDAQDKIIEELTKYKRADGLFGIDMAIRQRTKRAPDEGKMEAIQSATQGQIESSEGQHNADIGTNFNPRKSKKARKIKKKDRMLSRNDEGLLEKRGEAEEDEVYQISSGDEDCFRGMKKWIVEYHQSRPGVKILQQRIDDFITAHEAQEEQARKEREARAAEGGWTVVVHHRGRKKTTDSESGIVVGSVAQAAVMDKMAKKKNKEVGLDFYRFQKREAQRNEIMMLQSKFEQDKKRIQQLRAARKFRPY